MKDKLLFALLLTCSLARAEVVGQATSVDGHKVRLTDEKCLKDSAHAYEKAWGRTYAWTTEGKSYTGCGKLDNDSVLVEWNGANGPETRRYSVENFTWKQGFGK